MAQVPQKTETKCRKIEKSRIQFKTKSATDLRQTPKMQLIRFLFD